MKIYAIAAMVIILSCSPQSSKSQSKEPILQACQMDKISDLKNVIVFFGIPDDDLSEYTLAQLSSESFQSDMIKNGLQLVLVNEMCIWMEALIAEYNIKAFPTVLRLDKKGEMVDQLYGEITIETLRARLLNGNKH